LEKKSRKMMKNRGVNQMYVNKNCLNDIIGVICKCPVNQCPLCPYMNKETCICGNPEYQKAKGIIEIINHYKDKGNLLID
jgi:hypothetical protein